MTPDDVRMTAQLVVDKRVHCVSDDAVMAMARRVLELEAALDAAWESSAQAAEGFWEFGSHATDIARTIRARGAR